MILSIVCFTEAGAQVCNLLLKGLSAKGHVCQGYGKYGDGLLPVLPSLQDFTRNQFGQVDGMIFIGATGIAVRSIAPFLKGKTEDPAVVVMDDKGIFSISLLSGHLGGANELAKQAASITGGQPVITTATDLHGQFAVDLFAKEQGLILLNIRKVKLVSSAVLHGTPVGFFSDFSIEGDLPEGLYRNCLSSINIWISIRKRDQEGKRGNYLKLIPPVLVLGIGCRKGVSTDEIEGVVDQVLDKWNLAGESLVSCASIDLKKEEPGICKFAKKRNLPFFTYPADVLAETKGEFTASSFVKKVTGVDNVCERAALTCVRESGGGSLIVKKQAGNGITVALAVRDWKVIV